MAVSVGLALTSADRLRAVDKYRFKERVKYKFTGPNPYHRDKLTQKFKTGFPISATQTFTTATWVRVTIGTAPTGMSHTVGFRLGDDPKYVAGKSTQAKIVQRDANGKVMVKHLFRWNSSGAALFKSMERENAFLGLLYMGTPGPINVSKNARFQIGNLSNDFSAPVVGACAGSADKGRVKLNANGSGFQRSY
jgi:hypothetical protein